MQLMLMAHFRSLGFFGREKTFDKRNYVGCVLLDSSIFYMFEVYIDIIEHCLILSS